ncbi:MAG: NAD-dependent epimerase/dehydratase family protein [Acidimicrobiia bacterium]
MELVDHFQDRRVAVVGGAGFVGSNLVARLVELGAANVTVIDNLLSSEHANVPEHDAVDFVEGSITDDAVLAKLPTDAATVFHLATFHGNQNSMADPIADHDNNTFTTLKLLDHLRSMPTPPRVVYSSAGCTVAQKTFDTAAATTEDDPVSLHLDSPYQVSKIIGELYGNWYFSRHGIEFVKARFQNVYGPGEVLGAGEWRGTPATVWRNVTPTFVYRAMKGEPLPVENGGIATRDFIYVDDIVDGLLRCAAVGEPNGVYNLAAGVETPILELAETINDLTGNAAGIQLEPARDWDHSGKRFGSIEKAEREIGFRTTVALRDGLERTVAWTRANLDRIEACIARHRSRLNP